MISKERLEELIKEKKFIYWKFAKIKPSSWSEYTFMGNTIVKGNLKEIYSLDDLFETKEDFEWYREFGCIERTEKLELPTWEEIKHDFIDNKQSGGNYCVKEFFGKEQEYSLDIVVWNGEAKVAVGDDDFYEPLTKENYTLACRKCKDLFLGEKK